jgi:hypothetical protein
MGEDLVVEVLGAEGSYSLLRDNQSRASYGQGTRCVCSFGFAGVETLCVCLGVGAHACVRVHGSTCLASLCMHVYVRICVWGCKGHATQVTGNRNARRYRQWLEAGNVMCVKTWGRVCVGVSV